MSTPPAAGPSSESPPARRASMAANSPPPTMSAATTTRGQATWRGLGGRRPACQVDLIVRYSKFMGTADDVRADVRAWIDENWDDSISLREWLERLADSGWASPTWPEEW